MRGIGRGSAVSVVVASALVVCSSASAATITVTSTANTGSGCLLSDAILAADGNGASGGCTPGGQPAPVVDKIDLSGLSGSIAPGTKLPPISEDVDIVGPGASQLTITAEGVSAAAQPFQINSGAGAVSISGLTIIGGDCFNATCGAEGGAILNNGGPGSGNSLTLDSVVITDSHAVSIGGAADAFAEGGAIENSNGSTLNVIDSTLSDNSAVASGGSGQNGASGGAIMNRGDLTLVRTTLRDNFAKGYASNPATANVNGGAISNNGHLTIVNSTLSGNLADPSAMTYSVAGGAISQFNNSATSLDIEGSTIAGNTANLGSGGGIQLIGNQATITSSTITGNDAPTGANLQVSTAPSISNSIISDPLGGGANCAGLPVAAGNYNIESSNSCGLSTVTGTNKINTDPLLGPLQASNGGPTATRAPLAGSPAIDAGSSPAAETTDQRGLVRPSDIFSIANAAGGNGADIGAVEIQDTVAPDTVIDSGPAGGSTGNDRRPTFAFHSTEGGPKFQCKVDQGGFTACTSPEKLSSLGDGDHTFAVRAVDGTGNADSSAATRSFKIDATGPKTKIAKVTATTNKTKVTVKFSSPESGAKFECKVDSKGYKRCRSPLRLKNLKLGKHAVQVRATDKLGNKGTPAKKTFKVVRKHKR